MTWQDRGELRADPGIAPGKRNIDPPRRRSIWPSIAVAAAAATFAGVIWYAYQSGRVGNNGGVPPLVKAETGPIKVKPENPGGQEIPFQDSTVYDRLDQNGQKPVVEKLLPENEAPVTRPAPASDATVLAPPGGATPPPALPQGSGIIVVPPVAAAAPKDVASPPTAVATPAVPVPTVAATEPTTKVVPVPPIAAKAKPAVKPAADSIAALIGSSEIKAPPASPAQHPPAVGGAYRLQLSAVRTPEAVSDEWNRLKRRFPELANLKNSTRKIEVPAKGTFYRVEAGPLSEADAKTTCTRLRRQGLGCLVVKP